MSIAFMQAELYGNDMEWSNSKFPSFQAQFVQVIDGPLDQQKRIGNCKNV